MLGVSGDPRPVMAYRWALVFTLMHFTGTRALMGTHWVALATDGSRQSSRWGGWSSQSEQWALHYTFQLQKLGHKQTGL